MASTHTYTIDGIKFAFTSGTGHYGGDGVAVHPDNVKRLDNKFKNALALALFLFRDFQHYGRWSDGVSTDNTVRYTPMKRNVPQKYAEARQQFVDMLISDSSDLCLYYEELAVQRLAQPKHQNRQGFVYLLQSDTGFYKIGRTKNPKSRSKTFGVQLPFEVKFIATIATPDMHSLEAELHAHFASKRVNGEWFNLSPEDVGYIKSLAGA